MSNPRKSLFPARTAIGLLELVAHLLALVGHLPATLGAMLPLVRGDLGPVDVDVVPLVDVDIDVVAMPVEMVPAPDAGRDCNAGAPEVAVDVRGAGIVPVVGRIVRIPPGAVDDGRLIDRDVDGLGRRRLDDVDGLCVRARLLHDLLLLVALEVACFVRLGAQELDLVHHLVLLGEKRIAELLRPVELVAHGLEHARETARAP